MNYNIALLKGDGIGPEIVDSAVAVLQKIGEKFHHTFTCTPYLIGGCAIDATGVPLPKETVDGCLASDSVLLGAVGGAVGHSKWDAMPPHLRPEKALLGIREALGLFTNLRPAKLYPALKGDCPLREELFKNCTLCPRKCNVNRLEGKRGYCGMDSTIRAARAALHMWEEPCISGKKGSGAVFFSGCGLRCCFCQNRDIAIGDSGKEISVERLAEIFLELQEKGAANLNLVTGAHYVPHIISALELARGKGMNLPVVYNSSGYENVETIRKLDGYVDVYLPDMKYMEPELAAAFSNARDYPQAAQSAIAEMMRQTGPCQFAEDGYIKRGTIVRHLILPGHTQNSIAVLKYLYRTYGEDIFISVMNQYTPVWKNEKFPELNRKVTRREYEKVLDAAIELGIENGYFQEGETAEESFIPAFDYEGV